MPIPRKTFPVNAFNKVKNIKNIKDAQQPGSLPQEKIKARRDTESNIYLSTLDGPLESIKVQTIPTKLGVDPKANWTTIPVLGRNNPFYQYTGGEDTLVMTLDWYSNDPRREDVAENCRFIESWSRSNGWFEEPPRIKLTWGELFKSSAWIVTDAPYDFSMFDKVHNMLPCQAYQRLVLKKVVDYNTHKYHRRFIN
jgi:hypothetical protein